MTDTPRQSAETLQVVPYDPAWPQHYLAERARVLSAVAPHFLALEHIGSTAVSGLAAKPIIDMMAAVANLRDGLATLAPLAALGYQVLETGMPNRLFLRKRGSPPVPTFHLHVVEKATWNERNERLLRDYLQVHPETAHAYGLLKRRLAAEHTCDEQAYTRAKTAWIQSIVDRARDERGLPRVSVWEV